MNTSRTQVTQNDKHISKSIKRFFTTKDNLFKLIREVQGEQTVLRIKSYL